jgi:hypothetical protein
LPAEGSLTLSVGRFSGRQPTASGDDENFPHDSEAFFPEEGATERPKALGRLYDLTVFRVVSPDPKLSRAACFCFRLAAQAISGWRNLSWTLPPVFGRRQSHRATAR